jgi:hypothetical protein
MRPTANTLPHNSRVNMHTQQKASWTGGSLARVGRCIHKATPGIFGGWLDPVQSMGWDRLYFAFPISHLFLSPAESAKRYRLDGAEVMMAM